MSESIIIAILSTMTALLTSAIAAFATVEGAKVKNGQNPSCAYIGLMSSIFGLAGLVLGAVGASLLLNTIVAPTPVQQRNVPDVSITAPTSTPPPIPTNTPVTVIQPTAIPTQPPSNQSSSSYPIIQVGPYWGNGQNLMLNILSTGDCIDSLEIIIDGQSMLANKITDQNHPHYRQDNLPFEQTTGTSCNYLINGDSPIQPTQYFSIPATTYGIDLQAQWCYQASNKTWYPCSQ